MTTTTGIDLPAEFGGLSSGKADERRQRDRLPFKVFQRVANSPDGNVPPLGRSTGCAVTIFRGRESRSTPRNRRWTIMWS